MKLRKITSLSILLSFVVLLVTGILEYFLAHTRLVSGIHTAFGLIFTLGVLFHLSNNFLPLKKYLNSLTTVSISLAVLSLIVLAYFDLPPFGSLVDYGTRLRATQSQEISPSRYQVIEMNTSHHTKLSIDLMRSEHYWHPQMAIWIEDLQGKYIESIFVSKATAKGLFFGGRSKANFKTFDTKTTTGNNYRRVDALPVWSHKRGIQYADGLFVPTSNKPLPDGMTGATISENFRLNTSVKNQEKFKLRLELNVAFDDNEYYSEYDFPEDATFHNGTGQLGQPSIIFETIIDMNDGKNYYLMELIGHGHHSAQNGKVYTDLSTLTTARQLVERIVVGVKKPQ
ncbi:MAG TPA: hypothetical protein DCS93_35900 [Microscillaceae bacterium]|nr:hypothetical protein [Microscillaceae bacterium]